MCVFLSLLLIFSVLYLHFYPPKLRKSQTTIEETRAAFPYVSTDAKRRELDVDAFEIKDIYMEDSSHWRYLTRANSQYYDLGARVASNDYETDKRDKNKIDTVESSRLIVTPTAPSAADVGID